MFILPFWIEKKIDDVTKIKFVKIKGSLAYLERTRWNVFPCKKKKKKNISLIMQIGGGGISTVILGRYNTPRIVYDPSQF